MNQSNWIGAFIVIGFVCYIIANNQLPGYLSVLGINDTSDESSSNIVPGVLDSSSAGAMGGINMAP